jgi:hypothetical protein
MTVLSTTSPTKAANTSPTKRNSGSPPKTPDCSPLKESNTPSKDSAPKDSGRGLKRKLATPTSGQKRSRLGDSFVRTSLLMRPKRPVGEAWPTQDLRAFDTPADPVLRDVLKERGWLQSINHCPGTYGPKTGVCTFFVNEFKAASPNVVVTSMQASHRPSHALWFLGKTPSNGNGTVQERQDFVKLVVQHGPKLPGKSGNYRIAKFPETDALLKQANVAEAFKNKPWYPATYVMPKDRANLIKEIRSGGDSRNNYWTTTSQSDNSELCVWKGADPKFAKVVNCPRAIIQQCIADPLLIGGHKFRMRVHLVITNLSPLEAFVHENGQCLFASKPHNLANKTVGDAFDPAVHLADTAIHLAPEIMDSYFKKQAIDCKNQQFGIRQLVSYLTDTYPSFKRHALWKQILNIASDAAEYLAQGVLRQSKIVRDRHYEIFAMDLMLDKEFKVWMNKLEMSPGLGQPQKDVALPTSSSSLDGHKDFLHDVFTLLGLDAGRQQAHGSLRHWFELQAA